MPVTKEYCEAALARLAEARPIRSRKMFGGVGIYCQEVFFAVIDDDRLYFKVDEQTEPAYLEHGSAIWTIEGPEAGAGVQPYREVPAPVWDDLSLLGEWIDESVAAALRRKAKTSGRKPKPPAQ